MSIPLNKSPTPHYQPSVSTKILTIAKAGTLHFANFIADAVQKHYHSCLEAQTQFFELFNDTFNIFPLLLAPTIDICKVSNPEQKEIGLFGLQCSLTSRHVCGHMDT